MEENASTPAEGLPHTPTTARGTQRNIVNMCNCVNEYFWPLEQVVS
jgi:hypothetical protein